MNLIVAAAQYPISIHATFSDWKIHIENHVKTAVQENAKLLLFPEYGSMELVSLFPLESQQNIQIQVTEMQQLFADFCQTFAELARKYAVTIVAPSYPVSEGNKIHNRVCVFDNQGLAGSQDKFFMTRFENEEWGIHSAPKVLTLFESDWGTFGIQICYDVEFAIGSQLLCQAGADLILAPSCTETLRGATRVHIGARARAMENQCYTVVSQTVGNAPWSPAVDINYGFAAVYSTPDKDLPEEGIIALGTAQKETWLTAALDFEKIRNVRRDGQVFNFQDHQVLKYALDKEEIQVIRKKIR